ncbi:hypothetical protein Tco_0058666 [Tanacetum coccineum]
MQIQVKQDRLSATTAMENGVALDEEQLLFIACGQDTIVDENVDEQPVQDLALKVDNVFQTDDYDAFDSDVDKAPTAQTMFMANLSSADHVYDEAGSSYDSDILSEVHDNDHYQDVVCEYHEVHEMHDDVQPNYIVDSHADYTSDSNMIPYDQYVKDNAVPVVQSNVSSVPNDAYMMILNDIYESRAKFKLTEREQKINEQLRIVIANRNRKEENLKRELHSVKLPLTSTINHNKSMVEEVMYLKKDFKQRENKYLEEFLDMKALKEKVEDKLYKQDQSLQTVHMLCKPKPYYDEQNKVAIGYKNPLCLTRAKQVQPALYNGYEIIKTNHVPAIVHNSEDTLEIAEITKKKMNDKMKDQSDLIKMKAEALKEHTTASQPIKALAMYPPNTPATLVPRVLPTKSQLEAEVDQNVVNRKHDEIERKNFLFANDNLISDCLSKEVFYIATNYELTVSRFTEMHAAYTVVQARCLELEVELSKLLDKVQKDDHTELVKRFSNLEITQLTKKVNVLHEQNELFRAENEKVKQHYRELYASIKITRAKHIELTTTLLTNNENLKAQIHENMKCITMDSVKPIILAPGRYAIDVEPIPPRNRNNREVHLDYFKHLKESVETLREIVEEAKVERPLDSSLVFAYLYTKHSQELLEYVIGTCPKDFNKRDKNHAATPLTRKKKTNVPVPPSTGVNSCTNTSESQPRSNTKKNRILPAKSVNKKKVEEHPRTNKSSLKTRNRVDSSISSKRTVINSNSRSVCNTCNKCFISANHDMCVVNYLNASPSVKNLVRKVQQVWKPKQVKPVWKPIGKILTNVGYQWMPTGRTFTLGEQCPLTRLTKSKVVPAKQTENISYSKHMMGDRSRLRNFMKKFIGTVRFGNDHFGAIMGYGDYMIGDNVIFRVYYVEGLGHNLFFVGQFYDSDLEVAFRKHSCYV